MRAGRRRERFGRALPRGEDRERVDVDRRMRIAARIPPHELRSRIEDLERYRSGRRGLQVVIDRRAARRIVGVRLVGLRRRPVVGLRRQQHRSRRPEENRVGRRGVGGRVPQHADVVQDPEAAAVRRDDQIVVLDRQVAHRRRRQVQLQRLPVVAVVERHEDGELGAREQQSAARRILFDRLHVDARRQTARDRLPRLAAVLRAQRVRLVVGEPMAIDGRVRFVRRAVRTMNPRPHRAALEGEEHQGRACHNMFIDPCPRVR